MVTWGGGRIRGSVVSDVKYVARMGINVEVEGMCNEKHRENKK